MTEVLSLSPEGARGTLAYRTVNRELLVLTGGARALLMQLAVPGVAAGVDEHSDFRRRPVRRLLRTLDLSYRLAFGEGERLREAAAAINRAHASVRGAEYSAFDHDLLLWVHATLVDSALVAYSAFVRPLTLVEREEYYLASRATAPLLGLPVEEMPESYAAFVAYVQGMLRTRVAVDERARELGWRVLRPVRWVPGFVYAPLVDVTSALLPGSLRRAYGLPAPGAWWRWAVRWLPRVRRVAPRVVWEMPEARRAGARARGRRRARARGRRRS